VSTTWNPKDQDPVAYVGQTVVLDRIGGVEVEVDGKKLLLVRNDEILGVEVNEPVEIPF
jgi:co-chaperonin GroES (HSP10)